jgi:predicted ATPase
VKTLEKYANALSLWELIGGKLFNPYARSVMARASDTLGRNDDALAEIDKAIEEVKATGEEMHWAELLRIKGELLLVQSADNIDEAASIFDEAIDIARAQKAKSWELRAATALARLWRSQGKIKEAHDLLAPVYGWFTEGFDTKDLKEAKALLDELSD